MTLMCWQKQQNTEFRDRYAPAHARDFPEAGNFPTRFARAREGSTTA